MAESAAPPTVPAEPAEKTAEQTVDLRLISPSWETADSPLLAGLPASTTIGQLKRRVQEEVATRGRSSQGMRLIHRGRVLEGDARTLADVFGPNPEPGALAVHLVLRDAGSSSTAQPPSTVPTVPSSQAMPANLQHGAVPAATAPPTATLPQRHQQHMANQAQTQAQAQARAQAQAQLQAEAQAEAVAAAATAAATANARWMRQLAAMNNIQPGVPMPAPTPSQLRWPPMPGQPVHNTAPTARGQTARGRPSQEQGQPSATEAAGTFTTTNVTVQNTGGRNTVTYSTTTNMPARPAAPQPQEAYILSSPAGPRGLLVHGDAELYLAQSTSVPAAIPAASNQRAVTASSGEMWARLFRRNNQVVAYVLQQQQGLQLQIQQIHQRNLHLQNMLQQNQQQLQQLQFDQGRHQLYQQYLSQQQQQQQNPQQNPPQQQQQQQQQQNGQNGPGINPLMFQGVHMRLNNPGAGMLAAMVPHIWLVARLLLFVWWFTSPDASWTRWSMVILLATAMFVANTGMLDGAANYVWEPIRRHLDGLVPAVNVREAPAANVNEPAGRQQAAAGVPGNNGGGAGGEPNPAQMAARLVGQQRQANGDWLMEQIRRAERVGIMFLASLAPGVAERHVALVEQRQAEAERQREADRFAAEAEAAVIAADAAAEDAYAAARNAAAEEAATGDSTGMDGIAATPEVTIAAE